MNGNIKKVIKTSYSYYLEMDFPFFGKNNHLIGLIPPADLFCWPIELAGLVRFHRFSSISPVQSDSVGSVQFSN